MKGTVLNDRGFLFVLSLCAFFVGLDSMVVSPLIPEILDAADRPLEKGGLLITSYALMYGLTSPLFGPISDKAGRKLMIVIGMMVFSIGTFLTGISNHFSVILVFRAVTGIAGAMVMPSIFALVGDRFPSHQRGKAMAIVMGAMIGSTVLGVPIGALIGEYVHWQMTFWMIGLLGFLVCIISFVLLPKLPGVKMNSVSPIKQYFKQFKMAFSNPSVLMALLITFLWTIGLHGMFSYIGVFYHQVFALDAGEIGMVLFFAGLASVLGNLLGGKWSDQVGSKKVIFLASICAAIFVLLFSSFTNIFILSVLLHVLWSASVGVGQSSLTALVSQLSPNVRGTVLSLNSSIMYLGMTVASSTATLLLRGYTFLSLGLLCAVSAALVLFVIGKVEKTEEHPFTL